VSATTARKRNREVLDLAYYHEKSIDEIAEIVGSPASTVKMRAFLRAKPHGEVPQISRARSTLMESSR
jgi:RNA polymerase sigma-70 factor, ECF subfamily